MIFSSITFIQFFIIYFFLNLISPLKYRNYLIILGSFIFYAWWDAKDIWVPIFLTLIGFLGGKILSNNNNRKYILLIILIIIFTPLLILKYQGFFYNDFLAPILGLEKKVFPNTIPLGISFITFTITSYILDVFRKKFTTQIDIKSLFAYVMFFPQLIAGPILRPNELIPQLKNPTKFSLNNTLYPIFLFTIGLTKKVIFADYISKVVEPVFSNKLLNLNSLEIILGIYGFAVQIYCDFSGYTDMAIGLSLLLGINLPINFSRPYLSTSVVDFWRKWHITLSNFLKDYLYIPLGGNKFGLFVQCKNLFITMLLGGLWHGANWTFLVWGLIHGLGLIIVRVVNMISNCRFNLPNYLNIFITFNFITLSWIFFRANSLDQAFKILKNIFISDFPNFYDFINIHYFPILLIIFFLILHKWDTHETIRIFVKKNKLEILIPLTIILWILSIAFSSTSSGAFIYFDF